MSLRSKCRSVGRWIRRKSVAVTAACAIVATAVFSSPAAATTPTFDTVDWPIDPASVVTTIAGAGASMLLLVFAAVIGFKLIKKVFSRTQKPI